MLTDVYRAITLRLFATKTIGFSDWTGREAHT